MSDIKIGNEGSEKNERKMKISQMKDNYEDEKFDNEEENIAN